MNLKKETKKTKRDWKKRGRWCNNEITPPNRNINRLFSERSCNRGYLVLRICGESVARKVYFCLLHPLRQRLMYSSRTPTFPIYNPFPTANGIPIFSKIDLRDRRSLTDAVLKLDAYAPLGATICASLCMTHAVPFRIPANALQHSWCLLSTRG